MGTASEKSIERASGKLRNSWSKLGVNESIDEAIAQTSTVVDGAILKHLAFEWTQNAVEHGANFESDVSITTTAGDVGVCVTISDHGTGVELLEEKIESDESLYEIDGYDMGRGYGFKGAQDNGDVEVGFEKDSDGFHVHLLIKPDAVKKRTEAILERITSMQ